jgi:hypothetical protein
MRNYLLPLLAIFLLVGVSCQSGSSDLNSEEALLAVLQQEAEAFIAGDLEAVFALHTQDSKETRLELGIHGFNVYQGWEKIKPLLTDAAPGMQNIDAVNTRENVISKISGNTAWLSCDNVWEWTVNGEPTGFSNLQVIFFEKVKGQWKISFASYYSKLTPADL